MTAVGGTQGPTALVVCLEAPYPPSSGGRKRVLRLIEAIQRSGAQPHVLANGRVPNAAVAALAERGIRLEAIETSPRGVGRRLQQHVTRNPSPKSGQLTRRVADRVDQLRPAFLQIEWPQIASYRLARGLPVALSTHNVESEVVATVARAERPGSLDWLRHWNMAQSMWTAERRAARKADVVLCVSDHDAARYSRTGARVVVVPNGADDDMFTINPELPDSETVLFYGVFGYEPNFLGVSRFLREGWPAVASKRPNARLRLVGAGLQGELAKLASASERVEVTGLVPRLDLELARSSAVVIPIWQGGGTRLKVIESLAAARPIAGTPFGVGNLGFVDRRHGLVAETPLGLARAIVTLLEDRALAGSLAMEGRRLAERYRWRLVTQPAEALYRGWVERAEERRR